MHKTSFLKAEAFFDAYVKPYHDPKGERTRVLDIGSRAYEGQRSYADIFKRGNVDYVGLDLEMGTNVHIVPGSLFVWDELEDESFDFCVSGQTFEHNPFFWITFAEIARILKQDGMALIVAPGRGPVHRYPVDCWRFYPDAWQSLCSYTGLELVESLFEDYKFKRVVQGAEWCDSSVVVRKPRFDDRNSKTDFYYKLDRIRATMPRDCDHVMRPNHGPTQALASYEKGIERPFHQALKRRLRRKKLIQSVFRHF